MTQEQLDRIGWPDGLPFNHHELVWVVAPAPGHERYAGMLGRVQVIGRRNRVYVYDADRSEEFEVGELEAKQAQVDHVTQPIGATSGANSRRWPPAPALTCNAAVRLQVFA